MVRILNPQDLEENKKAVERDEQGRVIRRYVTDDKREIVRSGENPFDDPYAEGDIRNKVRRQMQGQLDAIDEQFNALIKEERQAGRGREGRIRSVLSRSGLTGSPRGEAQADKVREFNRESVDQLRSRKKGAVQDVLQRVDERADILIEAQRLREEGKAEQYLQAIKEKKEEAREDLKTLAQSGVKLEELDDRDIQEFMEFGEFTPLTFEAYFNANRPQEETIDYEYEYNSDTGEIVAYGVDPATGRLKVIRDQSVTRPDEPGDWKFKEIDGKAYWIDEKSQKIVPVEGIDDETEEEKLADDLAIEAAEKTSQTIDDLLDSRGFKSAVGPNANARVSVFETFNNQRGNAIATIENIISQLTLDKLIESKSKGATFGALSDSELKILAASATKLNTFAIRDEDGNVTGYEATEDQVREELKKIKELAERDIQRRSSGGEMGNNDEQVKDILREYRGKYPNASDEELLDIIEESGVLGSNRPQRNNNPGNVKVGGVGDRFAKKDDNGNPVVDDEGHLVFENPSDGLKALRADLKAKVEGNSQAAINKLGRQAETLSDLGQVYAEDPNWSSKVAEILGVNEDTPLSEIEFNTLMSAVMRQEGYFA